MEAYPSVKLASRVIPHRKIAIPALSHQDNVIQGQAGLSDKALQHDLVYHQTTMDTIKKQIKAKFAPGAKFGVAEFKEVFDFSRKHAIPLLEHLDREKFTRRVGNDRILL